MAGEGGDTGGATKGGGDSSGFGGGGDSADYGGGFSNGGAYEPQGGWTASNSGSPGGDVADYSGSGSGASAFTSTGEQAGFQGAGTGGVDSFINDPTGGTNLSGPGPVGGDPGQPGAGGGTNTPFAWDNVTAPSMGGVSASDFIGNAPVAAGGVNSSAFDTGTTPITSSAGFDNLVNSSTPAGTSAGAIAAPSGVSGNTDISSVSNLSTAKPTTPSSPSTGGNSGGILSSLGLGGGNALGAAVSGIGLANNLINGKQAPAGSVPLTQTAGITSTTADQQTQAGQALQQWQTTGTLPASYESQVQQAAQAAKTRAISNAAAQGLPTDPTQNTALAQQLNAIDAALPGQREAIAAQLAQSGQQMVNAGLQATGISSGIYQNLAKMEQDQNTARGAAIANFASALNGGGNKGLTLKVA